MAMRIALVAIGGAAGAVARYLLGLWIATRVGPDFPWATFTINLSGAFLIGVVLGLATEGIVSPELRLLLAVVCSPLQGLALLFNRHDRITAKHRVSLVAGDLHSHGLGYTSSQ